jgi:hypothetical protein
MLHHPPHNGSFLGPHIKRQIKDPDVLVVGVVSILVYWFTCEPS